LIRANGYETYQSHSFTKSRYDFDILGNLFAWFAQAEINSEPRERKNFLYRFFKERGAKSTEAEQALIDKAKLQGGCRVSPPYYSAATPKNPLSFVTACNNTRKKWHLPVQGISGFLALSCASPRDSSQSVEMSYLIKTTFTTNSHL
jgi:hypothetical protein